MVKAAWKKSLYFWVCKGLNLANNIIPKNSKKIFFFVGSNLSDNSLAVMEYCVENNYDREYKLICGVKHKEAFKLYTQFTYVNYIMSIHHYLTSKYVLYHGECFAIAPSKKQLVINLAHGTPMKCFNKTAKNLDDYGYDYFTHLIAPSPNVAPLLQQCYGCDEEKMVVLGFPRCDWLFSKRDVFPFLKIPRAKCKKLFMWMPTYRVSRDDYLHDISDEYITATGLPLMEEIAQLEELNELLSEQDAYLIIKIHPAQNMKYIHIEAQSNIVVITNDDFAKADIRLYEVLANAAALLTDYSSVFFDYLLLDRPIGFAVDDINSYGKNRGFMLNPPEEYMPGPKINSFEGIKSFFTSCVEEDDLWSGKRKKINDFANFYKDGENCRRLMQHFKII